MRELLELTGIVLFAAPVGEYDKRLVILTRERGKITAFARGAKRAQSSLRAVCSPFVFGIFQLSETRDAYNLYGAEVQKYFTEVAMDPVSACYASYFAEFASYYSREGVEAGDTILLLYQSLRALLKDSLPNALVRRIFELRLMVINGEYTEEPSGDCGDGAVYTWRFVASAPLSGLYRFVLKEPVMAEFSRAVARNINMFVDRHFHSLDVLEEMTGLLPETVKGEADARGDISP